MKFEKTINVDNVTVTITVDDPSITVRDGTGVKKLLRTFEEYVERFEALSYTDHETKNQTQDAAA